MMKTLLIAAGGHGRVVLDSFLSQGLEVFGILEKGLYGQKIFNVNVIGDDDFLTQINPKEYQILNGFGFVKSLELRVQKYLQWTDGGFRVIGTQHPSIVKSREVSIGISAQVMAGVVIQNRVSIGENAVINTRCSIDHDVEVREHAFISPGVVVCGGVQIGKQVFIGAGATILPYVKIGDRATIPAGSIVKKDVESDTKYNSI
jgi:sugar O-acyltransferase (sialic acid O-acetyltransferase NeuD family)